MNKLQELSPNIMAITTSSIIIKNGEDRQIDYACYVISILNLIFSVLNIVYVFSSYKRYTQSIGKFKENVTYNIFFIISWFVNVLYSIAVINYYVNNRKTDRLILHLSVSTLTIECIDTIFALIGIKN